MVMTTSGFDGSMDEAQFAKLMSLAGVRYSVEGATDFLVTEVPSTRSVSVAGGSAYGSGVLASSNAAITAALPTPTLGAWHLIVLHRDWAANTVTVKTIPGVTTTLTTPTVPPTTFPAFDNVPGVLDDQKLAWAWVNTNSTAVLLFDLRDPTIANRLSELKWADITGKPATFTPSTHTHSDLATSITSLQTAAAAAPHVYVQSGTPSGASSGDLWFW